MGCCGRPDPPNMSLASELEAKWGSLVDQSAYIFTHTERYALAYLAEQASKSAVIVESGTHFGRSAKVMLDASPNCHMWCVDPFYQNGTHHTTNYFLREEIAASRVEIINKRSPEAAPMLEHMRGRISLCFIDDGHAFSEVMDDLNAWLPLMAKGGLICGHDLEHPDNDVTRAVRHQFGNAWFEPVPRVWAHLVS